MACLVAISHACTGPLCQVAHFHYHAWPDHGVPSTTQPLRDLVGAVKQLEAEDAGPPVVHCSAGGACHFAKLQATSTPHRLFKAIIAVLCVPATHRAPQGGMS